MSEPNAPHEPDDYKPRPLMGPSFWIMLALAFVCVAAGAATAMLLPRLMPAAPEAAAPARAP